MKRPQKLIHVLHFPHIAVLLLLTPAAIAGLVLAMGTWGSEHPLSILAYVLSAYTLSLWCLRLPRMIAFFKAFKQKDRFLRRWTGDPHLRVKLTLWGSLLLNAAYALLQLGLGLCHASFWYLSISAYYFLLAGMRLFLAGHTRRHRAGEELRLELIKYRACGWVFLLMNLALALMVFFMVYWDRTFRHHEITAIAMAAYTFTSFTLAVCGLVKYRSFGSPVYSAVKIISLAAACVSMLTLTSTMLTAFGSEGEGELRRLMLALVGGAVSAFVITMALHMILQAGKKIKALSTEGTDERS